MNQKTFDKRLNALEKTAHVTDEAVKRILWRMKKTGNHLKWMLNEEKTLEEIAYGAIDWNNTQDIWRVLGGLAEIKQVSGDHGRDELVETLLDFLDGRGQSTRENTRIPSYNKDDVDILTANEFSRLVSWVTIHEETMDSIRHKTAKDTPLTCEEEKYTNRFMNAADRERKSRGDPTYAEIFEEIEQ